jgi:hypothetical protein
LNIKRQTIIATIDNNAIFRELANNPNRDDDVERFCAYTGVVAP